MDLVSLRELLYITSKLFQYYWPWRQTQPTRVSLPSWTLKAELGWVTGWCARPLFSQVPLSRCLLSFRWLILECLTPRKQTGELWDNRTASYFIEIHSHNSLWTLPCQRILFCFPLPGSGLKAIRVFKVHNFSESIQRPVSWSGYLDYLPLRFFLVVAKKQFPSGSFTFCFYQFLSILYPHFQSLGNSEALLCPTLHIS